MLRILLSRMKVCSMTAIPLIAMSDWTCADPVSTWDAASGLKPDEISEPYELVDNFGNPPVLDTGKLIISTNENNHNVYYVQLEPLVVPTRKSTLILEMRLVSGSSSSTSRAPAAFLITIAPSIGTVVHIDVDRVFFSIGQSVIGPISNVDTDDAMHTYRLEHDGDGNFTLFHDDSEILTASAYESASDHGQVQRFAFGEISSFAFGVSEWGSVSHDFLELNFKDSYEALDQ